MDVWILGNLTIDDLVLPDGTTHMGLCGGNAIFAALGARLWSGSVGLSARIGPDFPLANVHALKRAGLRLELSEVEAPTLHSWALYESAERRRFIPWLDSGSHVQQSLLPAELPESIFETRLVHVAPMPLQVQAELVAHLAARDVRVSLDPHDEYIAGAEASLLQLLGNLELFLPSRQEAALLYGRDDPVAAAHACCAAGARVVAIKLGVEGSLVLAPNFADVVHIPCVPVEAADPTGAGDAYCGAFCASYAQFGDAIEAALRATVAASLTVEQPGALAVLPYDRGIAEQRLTWLRNSLTPIGTETCTHAHGEARAQVG
jgi:sugar/nucleoside kinase (ribokinase family)